jgi:exopolysaccharide biosynthesis polyprenyl glycosylphosphotransferase
MRRQAELFFRLTLLATDAAMVVLAFYAAYKLRPKPEAGQNAPRLSVESLVGLVLLNLVALLTVYFFYKLYHLHRGQSRLDEIYSVLAATTIGILGGMALTTLVYRNEVDYPREMILLAWVFTALLVSFGRVLHSYLRDFLHARGWGESRVLIVGAGEAGNMILGKIRGSPRLGYHPVGFLDDERVGQTVLGLRVVGRTDELGEMIEQHHVNEVILALPEASHEQLLSIVSRCEDSAVSIKVFPDVFQIMAAEVNIGDLAGLPLLAMRDVALRGWRLTLKRIVDVMITSIVLIFISPVMLLIASLVRLDSRGSVFYIQERMGLDAKPFPLFKFRSMVPDAEAHTGPVWTKPDDPRRTRLGAILRKYSLDELPQFINVFLGHMSLVGPRPERPMFVEQFRQIVPRYMERHREKAGLTGWAAVNGLRGDTSIWERTKYDLYYIENWSLWFDFKIMILTVLRAINDRNAY